LPDDPDQPLAEADPVKPRTNQCEAVYRT